MQQSTRCIIWCIMLYDLVDHAAFLRIHCATPCLPIPLISQLPHPMVGMGRWNGEMKNPAMSWATFA